MPAVLPLDDAELNALAGVADDPPMRCEDECVWEPFRALHRQSVECVPDIQSVLPRQYADEWAEDSAGFAARLCTDGLSLADGIATVQEWLWRARRLLRVMGAAHLLPAPLGTHPTPTRPNPTSATPRRGKHTLGGGATGVPTAVTTATGPVMLSPARITAKYAVSRSTVYAACRSGQLPHYRVPTRKGSRGKYLFREEDVAAWLESLRVAAGPPAPSASAPASSGSREGLFSELNPERLARAWKPR